MVGVVNVNDVDDGRTGTAQHNGQWPAKVLINILCPVHTHTHTGTSTSTHSHLYSHIPGLAVALLMFYESRFVCKFVGPQTPKNCNNIWQMFPFYCSPPSLCSTLPFQIVRILQTVGSFAHFFAIIMRCCLVPPRIRLSENFLYLIWPTVGACFTQLESHQQIQNTASKFHTPFTPNAPAQASLLAILSFVQFPSQLAIFPSANQLSLYFPIQRQRATIIS